MSVAAPPLVHLGPVAWARDNLFRRWYDTALTVVFGTAIAVVGYRGMRFVFATGRWDVVRENLATYMIGLFPRDAYWRVWAASALVAVTIGLFVGGSGRPLALSPATLRPWWPVGLFAAAAVALIQTPAPVVLTVGAVGGGVAVRAAAPRLGRRAAYTLAAAAGSVAAWLLVAVGTNRWGGLLLTLILATAGIVLSFPLGLLLALGRRSSLPVVRWACIAYIELIRGVPLITLLFMAAFAFGFFMPAGSTPPALVVRALVALVLFTAAYLAEIVRGGLQSIPKGQFEAALAVGLSRVATLRLVVLPQALRAVIPAVVGQFISLFKDTSLVVIIGLTDLLRVAEIVTSQPRFLAQGLQTESLVFASFVYWVGAYSMSRASQRLERRLGVGVR